MAPVRTTVRRLSAMIALIGAAALTHCGTLEDSAPIDFASIDILHEDQPVRAYLIPRDYWEDNGGLDIVRDSSVMTYYAIGRTPKRELSKRSGRWALLWECGGDYDYDYLEIFPGDGNSYTITCREN